MKKMDKAIIRTYVKDSIAMEEAHPTPKPRSRDSLQLILEEGYRVIGRVAV
jgi:hypothetical protein